MQNLLEQLKKILVEDERLVSEGEILKNKVIELGIKLDAGLLKLLLADKQMKKAFFEKVGEAIVFDKDKFVKFVSNKQFLPDSYTAFKNKVGLTEDGEFIREKKEVVLSWPYKDCVLEGGMTKEDQKRDEIFWNQTLAPDEISRLLDPKVFTNTKRVDKKGEHKFHEFKTDESGDIKDNLIIKGNNLLALHSLKKRFTGKVKLIYIDPPYNTGNDSFGYNDRFNHSSWLTFMKNRLEVARMLLKENGVITINIDDKEYSYLKVLCDEVFDKENFLNVFTVKTSDPSGHKTVNPSPYSQSEYILLYARNKTQYEYNIHYVASGYDVGYNHLVLNIDDDYQEWKVTGLFDFLAKEKGYKDTRDANKKLGKHVFFSIVAEYALQNRNRVFQLTAIADDAARDIVQMRDLSSKSPGKIHKISKDKTDVYIIEGRQVYFYSNKVKAIDGELTPAKPLTNLWTDIPYNGIADEGGVKLKNGKKPEKLLRRIIDISTEKGDLVLDYHLGSGTTVAVAHKLGRHYIGIEQLDYGENDTLQRLKNVIQGDKTGVSTKVGWKGGGDFVYMELAKWNENFVDEIKKAKATKGLQKLWETLKEKAYLSYKVDPAAIDASAKAFTDLSFENQKRFLLETLDQNHLYINYSEIDDKEYGVSPEDKKLNKELYG